MDFPALVGALMSNDNATRKQAEASYEAFKAEQPQTLVANLVQLLRAAPEPEARAFAPVLLRPLLEVKAGVYAQLDAAAQATLKAQLLEAVASEPVAHIRRKLGHLIAELAAISEKYEQAWPELLNAVSALTTHADALLRVTAFDLLAKLAEYVGDLLAPHKESFLTLFTNALNDASGEVQIAALKAASAFLLTLEDKQELSAFAIIVAPMLRIIQALVSSGDEVAFREVLSALVQIAEVHPKFFRNSLDDVARAMIFVCSNQELDSETRELALEFLISICENAGGMVRKSQFIVSNVVPLVIQLMCEVEEDETWVQKFDDPETFTEANDADNSISDAGAAAIDRLSSSLGGNAVLPVAIPVIKGFLGDADWRKRRAGLYATCLLGEGAKSLMTRELDNVVGMVLPFLNDQHPRVQYAALHSIGQIAEDFGEVEKGKNFQAKFHAVVVPALTALIQNEHGVLRTRALAASVVINFCNTNVCKAKYVAPYSQALLEALFNAMRSCPRQVQEQAITAVASVAKVIGDEFLRFYDIFIPLAKEVLTNAHGKEYSLLRGKSMESIALIGQAVGKERFVNDAKEIMEILVRVQSSEELEGPEVQYVAQSCVRIGSILKEDFVPYLPHVIPALIKQAQIQPDIQLSDVADDDVEEDGQTADGKDTMTLEIRGVGKKRLEINTSALEDKTNACNMLYQSALDLEGWFYPYVAEVAQVMIPLIDFEYVEDIRIVSSLTMAKLLNCAVDGTLNHGHGATAAQFPQQLFEKFFEPMLKGLQEEEDLECLGAFAEAMSAALEVCKESQEKGFQVGIPLEHVPRVVEIFKTVASNSAQRLMTQHHENQQDEDYDAEAALQQTENDELEEGVFRSMVDSIGWIVKIQKEAFFPVFKSHMLAFVTPLLEQKTVPMLRGQAICMIDDIIEHCGAAAQELVPLFLNHLVQGLEDQSPSVIQASAYGIGVSAEKCGAAFDLFCQNALEKMVHLINVSANVDDDEVGAARDNAISAVAKICLAREGAVDAAKMWPLWLSWLPLRTDVLEARDVHARLISLVNSGNAHVIGADYANLPQILKVFASALLFDVAAAEDAADDEDMSTISEETKPQLRELLAKLQSQLPGPVVQGAWSKLSGDEQQALSQL
ncbi:Importin-5 [Phytophthora rubi]|uniref:Importin-5 n=1 Tax=Phytophthora rubi TaxID=129364 RepID=A0A6A4FIW9_9STRA|nr:Importin-5 [Phytophthora rubi]KAE9042741.1 Importin-5 [Phytophthora rubi]KAE9336897.1 Importin-5 [Phytophthora rubi]